jgi:hypothetical protein
MRARVIVARLLVVLGIATCLWFFVPASASASDCGGAGYRNGAPSSSPFAPPTKCNNYAGNGARVVGGTGAGLAIGFGLRAYWRGARAGRTVYNRAGQPGGWNPELNRPAPGTTYYVGNRFGYTTDRYGRTVQAAGRLDRLGAGVRNTYQQQVSGRGDRLAVDEGGHIFGTRFLGPGEGINLTAMKATLNSQGLRAYYAMEQRWADLIRDGATVDVVVDVKYSGSSLRPARYFVRYSVNGGVPTTIILDNSVPGGTP